MWEADRVNGPPSPHFINFIDHGTDVLPVNYTLNSLLTIACELDDIRIITMTL